MPPPSITPSTSSPLLPPSRHDAFRDALREWYHRHGRDLPWRHTTDPYAILVSEMMLQQTTVAVVRAYYARWMARFPTLRRLAAAPVGEVLREWEGLGYYARARHLHQTAQVVSERAGGTLPPEPAALAALPGIGAYTAGAVATFAHDAPVPIVDANVARVLARLFAQPEPIDTAAGRRRLWEAAAALVPVRGARVHNSALMELGALVCRARQPACPECPVRPFCAAAARSAPTAFPVKKPRRPTVVLVEDCAWTRAGGTDAGARAGPGERLLLRQHQAGSRWRGLWTLPSHPGPAPAGPPRLVLRYPFTHHRVTLRVFAAPAPALPAADQRWWTLDELPALAMPAPHRRAVDRLLRVPDETPLPEQATLFSHGPEPGLAPAPSL